MSQKEQIISLLKEHGVLKQLELSELMYGDKKYGSNIYGALMSLVDKEIIKKTGEQPAFYSLIDEDVDITAFANKKQKKMKRDVSNDIINNETLEEVSQAVMETENYGKENELITSCLKKYPDNTNIETVAMKIGLIDITNSTNISRYKRLISVVELAEIIVQIPDIDSRIKNGDPEVVNIIARSNGNINLFSFASKYCCYHNRNLYERDDYSILDTVLKESLPNYFNDVTESDIKNWQKSFNYRTYNDYITRKLDELGITIPFTKRKFDHYIWFKNRPGAEQD